MPGDRLELVSPHMQQWAKTSIERIRRVQRPIATTGKPGRRLLIVHLDGVPRGLLDEAIATGKMPFFSRLVKSGAYSLDSAFWGSPASTPCFQAGLLYGARHPNLPAYSWFDRELGRKVRMNAPKDALLMEGRLARTTGNSLLAGGGTAYLSLFRADASNRLCMTSLAEFKNSAKHLVKDLRGLRGPKRQSTFRYLRALLKDMWTSGLDVFAWAKQLGNDFRHEKEYLLNRLFMIDLAWGLAETRALIDMVQGVPSVYLVFGNYDEVAHRRGPRSQQAEAELFRVDHQLEELYAIAGALEHPYDVYFVTDHGHVDSKPFEQRGGLRLQKALFEGAAPPLSDELNRALLDGRPPSLAIPSREDEEPEVIEAGNFAHIYLTRGRAPLESWELLSARYRDVLARVARNPEVGIVALRHRDGAVALIQGAMYRAEDLHLAPLSSEFNRAAVADLLRELPHMPSAGDLVLYGEAISKGGTVGFAWEFGSHGGLTQIETNSVIAWPTKGPVELSSLSHVTQLHTKLSEAYRS